MNGMNEAYTINKDGLHNPHFPAWASINLPVVEQFPIFNPLTSMGFSPLVKGSIFPDLPDGPVCFRFRRPQFPKTYTIQPAKSRYGKIHLYY